MTDQRAKNLKILQNTSKYFKILQDASRYLEIPRDTSKILHITLQYFKTLHCMWINWKEYLPTPTYHDNIGKGFI